jgi:hypothetical protein
MRDDFYEDSFDGNLSHTSERFRVRFLLRLVKEMIRHSTDHVWVLNRKIKKHEREELIEMPEEPTEAAKEPEEVPIKTRKDEDFFVSIMNKNPRPKWTKEEPRPKSMFKPKGKLISPQRKKMQPQKPIPFRMPPSPQIPEYPLPPTVSYLKPYPTGMEIDLGRVNPLVLDQAVQTIECNGAGENIVVKGRMGTKPTQIVLSNEDINYVLQSFATSSKIPLHEGVYKIAVGKLIISAIVSDVIGSKFIIRKMVPQQHPGMPFAPGMFPGQPHFGLMPPQRMHFGRPVGMP